MITFKPIILVSLVLGTLSEFFPISYTGALDSRIPQYIQNTRPRQLYYIVAQSLPFALSARDEQTEDCRRFKTCGDS